MAWGFGPKGMNVTTDKARKQAIRVRMAKTGEPYSVAARALSLEGASRTVPDAQASARGPVRPQYAAVDLLHQRLEPGQERLLQVLADAFRLDHRWPSWRWVRKQLGLRADGASAQLRSLPRLGEKRGIHGQVYGLVWASDPIDGMGSVNDTTTVGLTAAGLSRACVLGDPIPGSWCPADDIVRVLAAAVAVSEAFQPSRVNPEQARFGSAEVAALDGGTPSLDGVDLYELLRREPPFWGMGGGCTAEGAWHYQLEDGIERYAGVKTMTEYVTEVGKQIGEANANLGAFFPVPAPSVTAGSTYSAIVTERGWDMTAEQVRQVRLLLWLAAQEGDGLYTLDELYAGNDEAELALRDATALADRGLVDTQVGLARGEDLAGIKVRILPAGRVDADEIRSRQQNRAGRHRGCREALVSWLYEVDAIGPMRSRIWEDFWSDPRGTYLGDGFTVQEVDRAAGWLRRNGLIDGVMVDQFEGPVRAYLTDHGVRCVENFGGDVHRYVERMEQQPPSPGAGPTFNVTATHVQLATGNNVRQSMTVAQASQEVQETIQGITEMLKALGLAAGREVELAEVQQEAVDDITAGDARLPGLRRFIDWAVATAKAGASPAVAAAVQAATAGLLQNAEHVVRAIGQ
jgi:hypothetical protein